MEEYFFHETHPLKVELNARYSVVRESRVTHICGPWFQANEKHCVCPKGTYVPWPLSTSYAPSLFKPHHVYTCTSRSVTWLSVFRHYEQTYRPSQEDLQDWFTIVLQIFVVFPCGERARFLFWLLWHRFFITSPWHAASVVATWCCTSVTTTCLHLCLVCHQLLSWLCFIRIPTCDYMVGH